MADYNTKAVTIGGVTVTVSKKADGSGSAGERLQAFLEWLADRPVDPGYGVDEGGRPDQGLPGGGGTPEHPIAPGGERPTHPIAPGGGGGRPDNSLPGDFLRKHAAEIAKAVLGHCFDCKPSEPKR